MILGWEAMAKSTQGLSHTGGTLSIPSGCPAKIHFPLHRAPTPKAALQCHPDRTRRLLKPLLNGLKHPLEAAPAKTNYSHAICVIFPKNEIPSHFKCAPVSFPRKPPIAAQPAQTASSRQIPRHPAKSRRISRQVRALIHGGAGRPICRHPPAKPIASQATRPLPRLCRP